MRNLKLALRRLSKTPFVTAVAVASLALGIGANAAIYSMFDQILLRALPVRDAEALVNFASPGPKQGSTSCNQAGGCDEIFSLPMFRDLEKNPAGFTAVAGHRVAGVNLAYSNDPLSGDAMLVSGSYFPILGVRPALGRLLSPDDDVTPGGHFVTVLGYAFWESRLGADRNVLNQPITINGQTFTIVGVTEKGFEGTTLGERPMVYVPLSMRKALSPLFTGMDNRRNYWVYVFGRLKPGTTIEQASTAINAVYTPILNDVEAPLQQGMSDATMTRFRTKKIGLAPGERGQTSMHREAKTPLLMLFGITGIVLLIACANIANLLLARAASRGLEMAVRLSLGASRRQLISQLLTESVVLAVLGGVVSLIVAKWTLGALASLLPPDASNTLSFRLEPAAVYFAAAAAVTTGIIFGMFPALHSTRPDLLSLIRASTGQMSGPKSAARFRTSLVTAQIALSMALLISAGLFIKSLTNVSRVDLGVKVEKMVTFAISPNRNGYTPERSAQLFRRVEEELAAIPGVTSVTAGMVPLLSGDNWGNDVNVEGFKRDPDTDANARFNAIGPGYFRTFGVALLSGREFTDADAGKNYTVAIVNQSFAKKFGLGTQAVGKRMSMGGDTLNIEIVGLIPDVKYSAVKDTVPPVFYVPYRQDEELGFNYFYARTTLDPDQLITTVRAMMKRLDPNLPLEELKTMEDQVKENVFLDRMISTMSASFAVLATLLAAVGLYGVLAYTVAQRTREIGLRMALGADGRRVRALVLKQVGFMVAVGGVIGIAGALAIGKVAGSLLFGLKGNDPLVFTLSAAMLTAVALGAGFVPALRASKVDPMQALRYE